MPRFRPWPGWHCQTSPTISPLYAGAPLTSHVPRFYGWTVVAAAFVMAVFSWGLGFYGPSIYLKTVQDARGWSLALTSAAVTLHFLFGAVAIVNLPRLHARFGLPKVTLGGIMVVAIAVLARTVLSHSPHSKGLEADGFAGGAQANRQMNASVSVPAGARAQAAAREPVRKLWRAPPL